jgi:hypothetical protein
MIPNGRCNAGAQFGRSFRFDMASAEDFEAVWDYAA